MKREKSSGSLKLSHFARWLKIVAGRSYYHRQQAVGTMFVPGAICGYFNDLTGKVVWDGLVDCKGIPLVELLDGRTVYFPTTIIQKGLGHWDIFLKSNDSEQLKCFYDVCSWAIENQDKVGGWPTREAMGLDNEYNYSAMPQGEGVSLLVRAWHKTGNSVYIDAAKAAFNLMTKSVEDGGTAFYDGDSVYFEEYPSYIRNTVLNGWIFALFGIYDYWIATKDEYAKDIFYKSINTLDKKIYEYDARYWSYYDKRGAIASPFYHNLHISQLQALYDVTKNKTILHYFNKFKSYNNSKSKKIVAVTIKGFQKIMKPGKSVVKC